MKILYVITSLNTGEAMLAGAYCVVTDVGDSAYIVGDCGAIVPTNNAQAIAQEILRYKIF